MQKNWDVYFTLRRKNPPRQQLVEALKYVPAKKWAIDVGAGPMNETSYLLKEGFKVDAIDGDKLARLEAEKIHDSNLYFHLSRFEDYPYPKGKYDIVAAMFSLPFCSQEKLPKVFSDITKSLKPSGIFVGQLFGVKDAWNKSGSGMNFHSKNDALKLFSDYDLRHFEEEIGIGKTVDGKKKFWHIFHITAQLKT